MKLKFWVSSLFGAMLVTVAVGPVHAKVYDWTFSYQYPGQNFSGPVLPLGQIGSGKLTTSDSFTSGVNGYDGNFANFYTVTNISGTIAGATIIGLGANGSAQAGSGLIADNELAVERQGFVLAPYGNILINLDRPFDGGTQLALEGDSGFYFGGFLDTSVPNEYQGAITLSPTPTFVPEPSTWVEMVLGVGIVGGALRARRRRPSRNSPRGLA